MPYAYPSAALVFSVAHYGRAGDEQRHDVRLRKTMRPRAPAWRAPTGVLGPVSQVVIGALFAAYPTLPISLPRCGASASIAARI
jgi:hypothetical protein